MTTPSNWIAGALRSAPAGMPFSLDRALRGLAPMFEGPSLVAQQQAHDEAQEAAARAAGATTPQEIALWRLRNPDVGPVAREVAFSGATQGVRPQRLQGLYHGVRVPGVIPDILREGFQRSSSDIGVPATSMATDPMLSLTKFAESGNPANVLAVRTNVRPEEVRNLRPGEYSLARNENLPDVAPADAPAISFPQVYYQESEIAFPRAAREQGQVSLEPRNLTPRERDQLQRMQERRNELIRDTHDLSWRVEALNRHPSVWDQHTATALQTRPPTPAEILQHLRSQALNVTRYERPYAPRTLASVASSPLNTRYASAWEDMFPGDLRQIRSVNDTGRMLNDLYRRQYSAGEDIYRSSRNPDVQQRMQEQDRLYRLFTESNEPYLRTVQDLELRPTVRLAQRQTMQDLVERSRMLRTPFWQPMERTAPMMRDLGYTPGHVAATLPDREVFEAAARGMPDRDLMRLLQERLDVARMAE